MTKISVIIPTFNSWETLKPAIDSIEKQSLKPYEIIIVNNASTDDTLEKLQKLKSKIKIVALKNNTGVTGGRNAGVKAAKKDTQFYLFFDHDMMADKNMLMQLVEVMNINPNIGIVTPKIYYWDDKKRIWSAGTGINLWTGHINFRTGKDIGQYEDVTEVQVAPAAMLTRKKVIDKIKGFDNRYFATYEDTDFCFRASKFGFKTFYSPKAIAYHRLSIKPSKEAERLLSRAYWVGRNRILFMKDFGYNFYVFLVFLPLYIGYYLTLALLGRDLKGGIKFLHGTLSGLLSK